MLSDSKPEVSSSSFSPSHRSFISPVPIATVTFSLTLLMISSLRPLRTQAADEAHAALMNGMLLPFYVFHGYKAPENHYTPSGWMGDYGDLRFSDHWTAKDSGGRSVIRIDYTAKSAQSNGWAGIYWQNPPNNWGDRSGGFNLNGARYLTFKARGERGDETIAEFKVGGIGGTYADSGTAAIGPLKLTKDWKEYRVDLDGQELSSIAGGFCWTVTRVDNPNGAVFYLDNIRFE